MVTAEIGSWFKENREQYRWPERYSRDQSERKINTLAAKVKKALQDCDANALYDSLICVHRWKSERTTTRYEKALKEKGRAYLDKLLNLSDFTGTNDLEAVVGHLKIPYCNLPVCSAIASFLYGRKDVPIVDRFVAQFFTGEIHRNMADIETRAVLRWIDVIPFRLEDDGSGKGRLRLSVYTSSGFNYNLKQYHQLVSDCSDIADALNANGCIYYNTDGFREKFTPIDVEMAIFSWATRNSRLFDNVR